MARTPRALPGRGPPDLDSAGPKPGSVTRAGLEGASMREGANRRPEAVWQPAGRGGGLGKCAHPTGHSSGPPSCYLDEVQPRAWIAAGESRRDRELLAANACVRASLSAAARVLVAEFGATEVVVFGSFAPGGTPGLHSDVDLLVANLDGMAILRATTALSKLTGRDVDLVPVERARPEVVDAARRTGTVLHGS